MNEHSTSPSTSSHENKNPSSKYSSKFLVLVLMVIFYMAEERAWYAEEFHHPNIALPQITNYTDTSFAQFVENSQPNSADSDKSVDLKPNITPIGSPSKCQEATVRGWPPSKTRNMTVYLKPNQNTTVIMPRILQEAKLQNITYDDRHYNKTHILIVCQSAVENSRERRDVIRKTWAKDAKKLPVTVIFIVGMVSDTNQNKTLIQQEILNESIQHGDILQEAFIDSYFNLTLKSMFTLKLVNQLANLQNVPLGGTKSAQEENLQAHMSSKLVADYNITYIFKVDDDCYVNPEAVLTYSRVIKNYPNAIVGHVLGAGSPVIRAATICDGYNMTSTNQFITKVSFKNCLVVDK